jgi:Lon protease-like protein
MSHAALPLFPLGTVLFPAGPLSLRIFEPRYLDMTRSCLRSATPFGVVLILAGAEVGAVSTMADTGTTARVVDFDTLPDGLLGVICVGERRFQIVRRWQQGDGLHLAEVSYLPEDAPCALPAQYAYLSELLREVLPRCAGAYAYVEAHYDDAAWVANRLAEVLPLSGPQRLELLELADPLARLAQAAAWSDRKPAAEQV